MKLSVMLFPFHGDLAAGTLSPQDLAAALKAGGATGVEAMSSFADSHPDHWADLLRAMADADMQHVCLDVGANFVFASSQAESEVMDGVRRGLDIAASLDCPAILLPGSRPLDGMSNEEGRKRYSDGLARAAELAEPYGIVATIEDFGVYPQFACHSSHVLEVVRGTGRDDVRVTWDNGNFTIADEDPLDAWATLADVSVHVHIKDLAIDETGAAGLKSPAGKALMGAEIGAGAARVDDCLATLKHSTYDGWVSLEVSVGPAVRAARQGLAYMVESWNRA